MKNNKKFLAICSNNYSIRNDKYYWVVGKAHASIKAS
jgi:hypothetical protein